MNNMKCFPKIVNSWIQSTIFAKSSILDISLGSEYVSDYPEALSIVINWGFYFESFRNFSNLFSILLVLSISNRKFHIRCNKVQSSRSQMSYKIGVLKNFAIFTGRNLCWSVGLLACKFETLLKRAWKSETLLKRDSNTGVFLWILQNF